MPELLSDVDWTGKVYSGGWTSPRGGVLESVEPATGAATRLWSLPVAKLGIWDIAWSPVLLVSIVVVVLLLGAHASLHAHLGD